MYLNSSSYLKHPRQSQIFFTFHSILPVSLNQKNSVLPDTKIHTKVWTVTFVCHSYVPFIYLQFMQCKLKEKAYANIKLQLYTCILGNIYYSEQAYQTGTENPLHFLYPCYMNQILQLPVRYCHYQQRQLVHENLVQYACLPFILHPFRSYQLYYFSVEQHAPIHPNILWESQMCQRPVNIF